MPPSLHLFNGFLLISINGGGLERRGILSSILPGFSVVAKVAMNHIAQYFTKFGYELNKYGKIVFRIELIWCLLRLMGYINLLMNENKLKHHSNNRMKFQ
jgi:hypothetical protein